jgi:hypothetical protein
MSSWAGTWLSTGKSKKGKVVPVLLTEHDAMKAYWVSVGVAPFILLTQH